MKRIYLVLLLFSLNSAENLYSQQIADNYSYNVSLANSAFRDQNYELAGKLFSISFEKNGDMGAVKDRLSSAIAWAMTNELDSAFKQLDRIVKKGHYTDKQYLLKEGRFKSLYKDKRWKGILANIELKSKNVDQILKQRLERIYDTDQINRFKLDSLLINSLKNNSGEIQELEKSIQENDKKNQLEIEQILKLNGWPSADKVGIKGNLAVFLVLQHSPLSMQKQYFGSMQSAVRLNNARAQDLAYLEDRILVTEGKKQKYGTQFLIKHSGEIEFYPINDYENIDKIRKSVGLNKFSEYKNSILESKPN